MGSSNGTIRIGDGVNAPFEQRANESTTQSGGNVATGTMHHYHPKANPTLTNLRPLRGETDSTTIHTSGHPISFSTHYYQYDADNPPEMVRRALEESARASARQQLPRHASSEHHTIIPSSTQRTKALTRPASNTHNFSSSTILFVLPVAFIAIYLYFYLQECERYKQDFQMHTIPQLLYELRELEELDEEIMKELNLSQLNPSVDELTTHQKRKFVRRNILLSQLRQKLLNTQYIIEIIGQLKANDMFMNLLSEEQVTRSFCDSISDSDAKEIIKRVIGLIDREKTLRCFSTNVFHSSIERMRGEHTPAEGESFLNVALVLVHLLMCSSVELSSFALTNNIFAQLASLREWSPQNRLIASRLITTFVSQRELHQFIPVGQFIDVVDRVHIAGVNPIGAANEIQFLENLLNALYIASRRLGAVHPHLLIMYPNLPLILKETMAKKNIPSGSSQFLSDFINTKQYLVLDEPVGYFSVYMSHVWAPMLISLFSAFSSGSSKASTIRNVLLIANLWLMPFFVEQNWNLLQKTKPMQFLHQIVSDTHFDSMHVYWIAKVAFVMYVIYLKQAIPFTLWMLNSYRRTNRLLLGEFPRIPQ
eukprot:CAMPEP_0117436814 /NCGR_PEP_ID=MMETSP0759-20121206/1200_1 /TAXON_ID=63605 /ORGANISM="Percolomonas cosmopolitus, Strain WS" /LENGTH=593 /DNA_ID=CAMNT_0005228423 /DNA_START=234 /DNA_END=2015 /DNA_ORIENTATION=+